jgi:hypothetical protein
VSRLRDYGLLWYIAAPLRALWRFLVGARPFCPWPGCWQRVDPTCSGMMYDRKDEAYCSAHCGQWHRDATVLECLGRRANCPTTRTLRVVSGASREGGDGGSDG